MKNKKAQEGVIVTVLLVLVAIAAIATVAFFIIKNVGSGTSSAADKTTCLTAQFQITSASAGTTGNLVIKRTDTSEVVIKELKIFVNDKLISTESTVPSALEVNSYDIELSAGDIVRVNAVLNNSKICENGWEETAAAA
jgi:hypothetical protein